MHNNQPAILEIYLDDELLERQPIVIPGRQKIKTEHANFIMREEHIKQQAANLRIRHLKKIIKSGMKPVFVLVVECRLNEYDFDHER
jgi:hypothetical protein